MTTVTSTFTASNGTQTETLAHTWSISAAVSAAYWDPARVNAAITLSGTNNQTATLTGTGGWKSVAGVTGVSSGKVYFELLENSTTNGIIGVGNSSEALTSYPGVDANGWGWRSNGGKYHSGSAGSVGSGWPSSGVIMVAIDFTTGKMYFGANGTWADGGPSGSTPSFTGVSGTLYPMAAPYATGNGFTLRVANADFSYTPPAGFTSWSGA